MLPSTFVDPLLSAYFKLYSLLRSLFRFFVSVFRLPRFCFRSFASTFVRCLFLAKFLIAFLAILCSFQGAFFQFSLLAIPENDTELFLKNNLILFCQSFSDPDALRFRSVFIRLLYSFFSSCFLLMFPSARPRNLRSCFISHVSLERR